MKCLKKHINSLLPPTQKKKGEICLLHHKGIRHRSYFSLDLYYSTNNNDQWCRTWDITYLSGGLGSCQDIDHFVGVHFWIDIPQKSQGVSHHISVGCQDKKEIVKDQFAEISLSKLLLP